MAYLKADHLNEKSERINMGKWTACMDGRFHFLQNWKSIFKDMVIRIMKHTKMWCKSLDKIYVLVWWFVVYDQLETEKAVLEGIFTFSPQLLNYL